MRKINLTPGKFSQQSGFKQMDITPDKQCFIDKQRKSIERLSINPKATRRQMVEWQIKQKKYQQDIARLNRQKQQLQQKIQIIQSQEKQHKILQYEMYIVELNKRISEQESEFTKKYKALEQKLQFFQIQYKQVFANSKKYKNSLYDVTIAMTNYFHYFSKLKQEKQTFSNVEKQFAKIYLIVSPYEQEFQIQSSLQSMIEQREQNQQEQEEYKQQQQQQLQQHQQQHQPEQLQQQRCSVMTFPPNSAFKQTFNIESLSKQLFSLSTSNQQISFEANFSAGNSYEVKKAYNSTRDDQYLSVKKGDEVKLLRKNANRVWIAQYKDSIGFLSQQILF